MKKEFVKAEVQVIKFEVADILTMSPTTAANLGFKAQTVNGDYVYAKTSDIDSNYTVIADTDPRVAYGGGGVIIIIPIPDHYHVGGSGGHSTTKNDPAVQNALLSCKA